MYPDRIIIKGAREHNLKNIDVVIPRNKLVAITGVSGSGKSSLAFDTIYAEGQRRYMESVAAYARQFLGRMEKPDVDYIGGLSPAISIDQKGPSHNPRSTLGTITEIYDYLRLLFARIGHPHCPQCGKRISKQSVQEIVNEIQKIPPGSRIMVLAPIVKDRKGEHKTIFDDLRKSGFVRVRVDGNIYDLSEQIELYKNKRHSIDVIIDRLIAGESDNRIRLSDSVETALKIANGSVIISVNDDGEYLYSEHFACPRCSISFGELAPRNFSFNSPHGACPACTGLGVKLEINPSLIIKDPNLSIANGAIEITGFSNYRISEIESLGRRYGFSIHTPVNKLHPDHLNLILYGEYQKDNYSNRYDRFYYYEGIIPILKRLYHDTESENVREYIERFMTTSLCPQCHGKRLKKEYLSVKIDNLNIIEVTEKTVTEALYWVDNLLNTDNNHAKLTEQEYQIAYQILKEIRTRLGFLSDIGLGYLTLDRPSATLSGGEFQRIRLATQIGSGLTGVLYICDEPTIGLHPADIYRLIDTLKRLKYLGNTVIIVEHDETVIRSADHIIDMGPGAGENGGYIVAQGTIEEIINCSESLTGQYISKKIQIETPKQRRAGNGNTLVIRKASENNLKNIDVAIPLGKFVCVSGVSGSGKSTLINEVLYKNLIQYIYKSKVKAGKCEAIEGVEYIDKVINIDQSPIGRTPRSNPATYTGAFTPIRELFASLPEAKIRGYKAGRFSFNVKGGRCEACQGGGYIQIEMQFLPDVTVACEVCKGKRYNEEALEVKYKGKNIADILGMTVEEALKFFENIPQIKRKLQTLYDVGLGYIKLGQPATTLSGGESQRVKLAAELSKLSTGKTLYILDEPTTGLSLADIDSLLKVLQRLAEKGNSLIVIEHHLDVLKNADYIIDLGPGPGEQGGYVVATGTPEELAHNENSITGKYLRNLLFASMLH